ncbi:6300_t:CDS:2, partial [Racocetra persica]
KIHTPIDKIKFIKELVESISTSSTLYTYTLSQPVGRGTYNERYLYIYKKKYRRHSEVRITFVGCHTNPKNMYDKVRALVTDVYSFVKDEVIKLANERTKSKKLFSMDDLIYAFDNLN